MAKSVEKRILALLDAIVADHPRQKRAMERAFKRYGLTGTYDLEVAPAERVKKIATFKRGYDRPLTPMLKARFEHSGGWKIGQELWLSAANIRKYVAKRDTRSSHRAFREYWEDSAPMLFPDEQLSLFDTTDLGGDLTYLVWTPGAAEPEVWRYHDNNFDKKRDLEHYLEWHLKGR